MSKTVEEQRSRGAEERRSRGAEEQRCRGVAARRSRGAEGQRSRGAKVSEEIDRSPKPMVSSAPPLPCSSAPLPLGSSAPPLLRSSAPPLLRSSSICGIPVANLTEDEAVAAIDAMISKGGSHYAAVVNAAKIVAADRDAQLKQVLLEADLVTADGMSVVWASRLLGQPLKQRVTGIDLFQRLVKHAAQRGWSVYFLGARDESVRGTVERFKTDYPSLRVAGYRNGYFTASESNAVADAIKQSNADLLFVAMGSPAQENWIASQLARAGVHFALGVGGSFDHVSGLAVRAPGWMQRAGLEWLYRLMREPRRMWRRYLIGNSAFVLLVAKQLASRPRLR